MILAAAALATAGPASACGGARIVRKTFASGAAIAIPDSGAAAPYPATIKVSGLSNGRIKDVDLTLPGLTHTFPADADVLLVAPGGHNAVVVGDVGINGAASAVTDLTLTLDDEAANPLPAVETLTSGRFRPLDVMGPTDTDGPTLLAFPLPAPRPSGRDALSTFDGIDPNGTWRLFVMDDANRDAGSIAGGWTLTITARFRR